MNPGVTAHRDEYRRVRIILIAGYAGIAALAVGLSVLYLWSEYREYQRVATVQTTALTRALSEHVLRVVTSVDLDRGLGLKID